MLARLGLSFSTVLFASVSLFSAPLDKQDVSLSSPVAIPGGVLDPGKYTIALEDHLPDRAIVRISGEGGADHYLLVVPSKSLTSSSKGLIFIFRDEMFSDSL